MFTVENQAIGLCNTLLSMADAIRISPYAQSLELRKSLNPSFAPFNQISDTKTKRFQERKRRNHRIHFKKIQAIPGEKTKTNDVTWTVEDPSQHDLDAPMSIELEPIVTEEQFDRTVAEAQQLEESLIVVWMASWCRKCIYLKPKLEKLAVDYYPRMRFYCIDVNTVPQKLVNRAGITKMPTIQLWKDGNKQAEVIGGHKAWLVVNDVREMIQNEC